MAPDLAALPIDGRDGAPLPLVITTGSEEDNRKLIAEHGLRCPVLLQEAMEVASEYQCHGTPMGYRIDAVGRIASTQAVGADALRALARAARGREGETRCGAMCLKPQTSGTNCRWLLWRPGQIVSRPGAVSHLVSGAVFRAIGVRRKS